MMETTALKQFLKSLCNESCWNYAVFWKLQYQSPMLLTWEDGYYEPSEPMGDICFGTSADKIFCPQIIAQEESFSDCPIALALADMSYLQYPMGEGLVGEVASSGNHCWCYSDEIDSQFVPEWLEEWKLRFLGGVIKTILLVPVSPHGVLQLGSLEKVSEDLALVEFATERITALQNELSAPFPSTGNLRCQPSLLLMPGCTENSDDLSVTTSSIPGKLEYEDFKAVEHVNGLNNQFSTRNQVGPQVTVKDTLLAFKKDIPDILHAENVIHASSVDFMKVLSPKHEELSGEITYMIEQLLEDANCIDMDPTATNSFSTLPTIIEQHKVLAPDFNSWTGDCMWDSSHTGTGASSCANPFFSRHLTDHIEVSAWESCECFFKSDDAKHFESIFAGIYGGMENTLSESSNITRSFRTISEPFFSPTASQNQFEQDAILQYNPLPWNNTIIFTQYNSLPWKNDMTFTSQSLSNCSDTVTNSPAIASSIKNVRNRLADHQLQSNGYGSITMQSRKGAKVSKVGERRSGQGKNQRQRPRDRQMIHDRVKELKKLVPNGEKCSIDGLLERTIKHMLFLRSVSNEAEKFKEWTYQEGAGSRKWKSSETKGASQIGMSLAFQLGNELEVCPIVVEDLEYPGHFLIEMQCSEHGLFLEIAQVIRGLELTILDGKIENQADSTWARFIVKGSSGSNRMDIFWPLMHLYGRNKSSISSKI